jgi:hypothetical protein
MAPGIIAMRGEAGANPLSTIWNAGVVEGRELRPVQECDTLAKPVEDVRPPPRD